MTKHESFEPFGAEANIETFVIPGSEEERLKEIDEMWKQKVIVRIAESAIKHEMQTEQGE